MTHPPSHVLDPDLECSECIELGLAIDDIKRQRVDESPQDPASLSLVAEAIGLSFSTEDYAGSVAGLVAKVAKLHADNFSLRAEAALAKSEPPSSLRDGMDRLFDAIGSKDVGECISRLQSWGDERARQRQTIDDLRVALEHESERANNRYRTVSEQAAAIERLSNEVVRQDSDKAMLREMIRRMRAKPKKKPKKKARAKKR